MVESVDRVVASVVESLSRNGLSERTIIVFFSDNGGLSTSEGHPTSNHPLRAGKGWLYEGGIREPMFIHRPGMETAGRTVDDPVTSMDLYPTLLDMAGVPLKPEQHMDGISLVPLMEGSRPESRTLLWHYPHYSHQGGPPASAIRDGRFKYLEYYEDGRRELYDLSMDPGERTNLIAEQPARADSLRARLFDLLDGLDAAYPTLHPDRIDAKREYHPKLQRYSTRR